VSKPDMHRAIATVLDELAGRALAHAARELDACVRLALAATPDAGITRNLSIASNHLSAAAGMVARVTSDLRRKDLKP
jgi:hypothetical protein